MEITSGTNTRVKWLRSLQRKKDREQEGCFLIEGGHVVEEAFTSGLPIRLIAVQAGREEEHANLLALAQDRGVPILCVSEDVMRGISDTQTPQGILGAAPLVTTAWEIEKLAESRFLIMLDGVQDPGNMGTILRTADAAGCDGAILSNGCVDVHNPKTVRAAMGSLFHVPVWLADDLASTAVMLKDHGWDVLCGHLNGSDFYNRSNTSFNQALVIGNEANGVTDAVAAACTACYRLPMAGKAESLNAAVASGIMLYAMARELGRFSSIDNEFTV